jgi:hypothetical protein
MLKTKLIENDILLNASIFSEDYASDVDFYNNKLLNFTSNSVLNKTIDSEIYEYKPQLINEVNFNIYFLRYVQDSEYDEIIKYMELDFQNQFNKSKLNFGLIDSSGNQTINPYGIRQSNGLRETTIQSEQGLTRSQALQARPYYINDINIEAFLKQPTISGIPIFYNSYTLPYWGLKDTWINEPLLYTNKAYFYNSFLLLEFFDSPTSTNQNRIQSIPIFVNNRYNTITEKNITNNFHYNRPVFNLKEGFDGYSFFFLGNYITNEFYVKFSFWDSLNANKISLLPSSNINPNKKWLQDLNAFNQKSRYLKYVLDYNNKTYKIFEYNTVTGLYDTERFGFDLYELGFDSYFKDVRVENNPIINSKNTTVPNNQKQNPLTFSVKNLYTLNIVSPGELKKINPLIIKPSLTNTFNTFNNYVTNVNTNVFGNQPKKQTTLPVINRNIEGFNTLIKSFALKNSDNKDWVIRSFELTGVNIQLNGYNFTTELNTPYYNSVNSLWNDKVKYNLAECLFSLDKQSINVSDDIENLGTNIIKKYMEASNVFSTLLNAIERERFDYNKKYNNRDIPIFLDNCFNILGVKRTSKNPNYDDKNGNNSELHQYINSLVINYTNLKKTDITKFYKLRDGAVSLINTYNDGYSDEFKIYNKVITYINNILVPNDNPDLLLEYLNYIKNINVRTFNKNVILSSIGKNKLPLLLDRTVSELGYEPRNYLFDLYAICNGDTLLNVNETNNIDLYLNIGEEIKWFITYISEIIITGKLKISIIDGNNTIKNILVPIKSTIKVKK